MFSTSSYIQSGLSKPRGLGAGGYRPGTTNMQHTVCRTEMHVLGHKKVQNSKSDKKTIIPLSVDLQWAWMFL